MREGVLITAQVGKSIVDFKAGYTQAYTQAGAHAQAFAIVKIFDALKLVQAGAKIDELIVICFQAKSGIYAKGACREQGITLAISGDDEVKFW